jgi:hypothetical protein
VSLGDPSDPAPVQCLAPASPWAHLWEPAQRGISPAAAGGKQAGGWLQVWEEHPLCLCLGPSPQSPSTGALGLPGVSWPGPLSRPCTREMLITAPPHLLCLPERAGEVFWPTPALAALPDLAGWGKGRSQGPQRPSPLCGMEPPAASCHVVQHVTALLCCSLELCQVEAKAEPSVRRGWVGAEPVAIRQELGPERGSHQSKVTQQIRGLFGEDPVGWERCYRLLRALSLARGLVGNPHSQEQPRRRSP